MFLLLLWCWLSHSGGEGRRFIVVCGLCSGHVSPYKGLVVMYVCVYGFP